MRKIILLFSLFSLLPCARLGAVPGSLENNDYKVSISETMPGLDSQGAPPMGAAITVTVTDKFRSTGMLYPVNAYAIKNYFLLDDSLNLIARTTPLGNQALARFDFIQLTLSNPQDSRQFKNLRQYSFSPDQRLLLAVVDGGEGQPPMIGLAGLGHPPARMGWIYAQPYRINHFGKGLSGPVSTLTLNDPAGWSADAGTVAFVLTVGDGTQDAQGKPALKDYLGVLQDTGKGWAPSLKPLDLSSYHFHQGAALMDLQCGAGQAKLFLTTDNSTSPVEVDIPLVNP